VGTPSARTGEDVFPLLEIVSRVPGAAAFFPSLIDRNRLGHLPTLDLPFIEKHGDGGTAFEPPLKAPVQFVLAPRHNQQDQRRGFTGRILEVPGTVCHFSTSRPQEYA
jgi:hypothetical protein